MRDTGKSHQACSKTSYGVGGGDSAEGSVLTDIITVLKYKNATTHGEAPPPLAGGFSKMSKAMKPPLADLTRSATELMGSEQKHSQESD